jgi:hypothetical protein
MSGPEVGVMLVIDRLKDKVTAAEWDEIVEVAATFVYVERVRGVGGDWWFDVIATSDDVPTGNTPVQYGVWADTGLGKTVHAARVGAARPATAPR